MLFAVDMGNIGGRCTAADKLNRIRKMAKRGRNVSYRDAGVDIDSKSRALDSVKKMVSNTFNRHVLSGIGHFGTLFDISGHGFESPVLVASTDGVGTKLKIAFMAGRHDTVGIDLVNHCANDILVQGATPFFFLDYIAWGRFDPGIFSGLMKGLTDGCAANEIALVGGETAEMPGFYEDEEYDLVGFIVGGVEKGKIVDGNLIRKGDVLLGIGSSGLHTNGYSLVRKILFDMEGMKLEDKPDLLENSLGDELLKPHMSYRKAVQAVEKKCRIKGMAHITGGGLTDNIPRVLPDGSAVRIRFGSWTVPPIFRLVIGLGGVSSDEALKVFNMGIGFVIFLDSTEAGEALESVQTAGYDGWIIGEVVDGQGEVEYEGV